MRKLIICLFGLFLFPFLAVPSFSSEPIILGVPTSLKLIHGHDGFRAVQLAAEEINAKGGFKVGKETRLFKVEGLDIRDGEPGVPTSEALLGIEKLILDKKVYACVIGNFRSEALLAAMDIYSKYKIINFGNIAMSPKFQEKLLSNKEKYKYSFRSCLDSVGLAKYMQGVMTEIGKEFKYNKAFIITQDVLWATATGSLMEKWFKENGWEVLGFEKFPTGATDFSTALMKVNSTGAQTLFPIFDMQTSGILVKQWRAMKVPAIFVGILPFTGAKTWKALEGEIEGAINFIYEIGQIPVKAHPKSVQFYDAYQKRWNEEVQASHGASSGYDSVYMLKEAIEKAGTLDKDKVVAVLEKIDFDGVIGRVRFDEGHQVIFGDDPKKTAVGCAFQWQKGKRIVVFPSQIKEGSIEKPTY